MQNLNAIPISFELDLKKESNRDLKKVSGASHDLEALQDIMAQNWTKTPRRGAENSSNNLKESSDIVDEEESVVSSI